MPNRSIVALSLFAASLFSLSGCLTADKLTQKDEPLELTSGTQVKVVNIIKGDEIEVQKDGKKAKLRLLGLFGFTEALDDAELAKLREAGVTWLLKNVLNKEVTVTIGNPAKDPHGRTLGYAALDGTDLGTTLLAAGAVVVYTEFPIEKEVDYLATEAAARAASTGLWTSEKATKLATGLRRDWNAIRAKGSKPLAGDPLLGTGAAPDGGGEQPAADDAAADAPDAAK